MAYIGKQPVVGNFVKLDAIVTSATATYNLLNGGTAYFPQTANNCIVSLNGVIQSPTSAYTISGSTIIFDSALTSLDVIDFILVLGDVLAIGTPSDGTVSFAKVTSNLITGATSEATIAGGDSVLIYDDSAAALRKMTRTNFVSGIANTPAFYAHRTANQSIPSGTATKVQLTSELFDTGSCFDSTTNYRFTPTTSGKYYLYGQTQANSGTDYEGYAVYIKKNGTTILEINGRNEYYQTLGGSVISSANGSSDYFELFSYNDGGGSQDINSPSYSTFFMGYKIIE